MTIPSSSHHQIKVTLFFFCGDPNLIRSSLQELRNVPQLIFKFECPLNILVFSLGMKIFTHHEKYRILGTDYERKVSVLAPFGPSFGDLRAAAFQLMLCGVLLQLKRVYACYAEMFAAKTLPDMNQRELFQEALRRNGLESLVVAKFEKLYSVSSCGFLAFEKICFAATSVQCREYFKSRQQNAPTFQISCQRSDSKVPRRIIKQVGME